MTPIAFYNGTLYTGKEVLRGKAILTDHGSIVDIVEEDAIPSGYAKENLEGVNLAPAFIDLQIYGGNGKMFSQELSIESLEATHAYSIAGGAAHFMITMATNSMERFFEGMNTVKRYWEQGGKGLLGLHLEGPYINPVKKGAHIERYIKIPTREEVQSLVEQGRDVVKMITVAPEICTDAILRLLLDSGIIVSAGHTNASYRQALQGISQGIPAATHLFNAMSAFQSREPGMVGAIYDHPKIVSSVVCDGIHVDFAAIRISKRLLQERLFFITDAVTETLEGEYQHVLKGDRYTLPDGTLSGSTLTMLKCVKNAVDQVGIHLEEALRMASLYPARLLGEGYRLGSIQKGYQASFVAFSNALELIKVY